MIHFHHASSAEALALELAAHVADRLRAALQARKQALLVVSGGSTPVPFFKALSVLKLDWARVTVTLADERWLPPDHPDSNEGLVKRHLLQAEAAGAQWVSLYNGAPSPQAGCSEVEHALAALAWPADVVVLGMGGDGHTASLFPHHPDLAAALSGTAGRCVPVSAPALPNVPVARMTLSLKALLDTRELIVHITGASKLALLKQAMQAASPDEWPIKIALQDGGPPCVVFHAE